MGILDVVKNNPLVSGAIGGVTIGSGVGYIVGRVTSGRKKTTRQKRTRVSKRRSKRTSRKNKTSRKRNGKIKYTKKGQPYIIQSNGRARFIKKKSAKISKKRKGGYY